MRLYIHSLTPCPVLNRCFLLATGQRSAFLLLSLKGGKVADT